MQVLIGMNGKIMRQINDSIRPMKEKMNDNI